MHEIIQSSGLYPDESKWGLDFQGDPETEGAIHHILDDAGRRGRTTEGVFLQVWGLRHCRQRDFYLPSPK